MKNSIGRSVWARTLAAILILLLGFALAGMFFGCGEEDIVPPNNDPPESVPKVHSVAITYNDAVVSGLLTVDISLANIEIGADVTKDEGAEGKLVFGSSDADVATIDGEGKVALLSAGETVITASYGSETCSIVLSVVSGTVNRYTITVNGGHSSVTTAAPGDIVTLTPEIPQHKEFSEWLFDESGAPVVWTSGNMFKMPEGNVVVSAEYTDMLYTLRLIGATVSDDGSGETPEGTQIGYDGDTESAETAITEYKYPYEAQLTLSAAEPGDNRMFVGWDLNTVNNRMEGEMVVDDFVMSDDTTTLWANFSEIKVKKMFEQISYYGWNATPIDGSAADADPDLEGLYGYKITIPGNQVAQEGYDDYNNLHYAELETINSPSQAVRAIFKNHGDKDVTLELYLNGTGGYATGGPLTVPAGELATKTFIIPPGFYHRSNFGFVVRESLAGGADVIMDVVMASGDAYPKGDPTFAVTAGTQRVELENYVMQQGNLGAPRVDNNYSWTMLSEWEHNASLDLDHAVASAKLKNLPAFDPEDPYLTLYIKMINRSGPQHEYSYKFGFGTDVNPLDAENNIKPGTKIVDFTVSNMGETRMFAIRIPRSEADENFYFSIIKDGYDTPDGSPAQLVKPFYGMSFSVMLTYNNGIGFDGEVVE